jgi:anti-sigma regulatory factor (Ser/Thr protein kinase)
VAAGRLGRTSGHGFIASIRLTNDHLAPAAARLFIRATLTDGASRTTPSTAELCVSELVTNAVIPNRPAAELMARLHADVLTVSVRDSGGDSVVRAESFNDPLRVAGRGLSLVEALTTGLGDRARCPRHDGLVRAPERVGYCLTKVAPEVRLELRPHDRQQPGTGADRPCLALVRAPSE